MKNMYKKLLIITSSISIITITSLSVVSCDNNGIDDIYRPDPILPISKKGFENVNLESIDIEKINYTDDLLNEINQKLIEANYDLKDIEYKVFKNEIEISMEDDLYRNGKYRFEITNKLNPNDQIIANITITNSLYLSENFKITDIGEIDDYRPNSILLTLMFYNMNMLKSLTEIAEQLTNPENFEYIQQDDQWVGAKLSINDEIPTEKPTGFYGSLDLTFTQKPFEPSEDEGEWPKTIEELVKLSENKEMKTHFERVEGIDPYTILMHFITDNLQNARYWSIFLNDLDLDNFEATKTGEFEYEMLFYTKEYKNEDLPSTPEQQNGEYDNFAHFINQPKTDPLKLTFTYYG